MRANIFKASLLACLLSTTALADTSSMSTTTTGMGVLANDYVTAGVNGTSGTFGSGGNTSPGLLYDSTGTGTFNTSYDYLTPGSPFDGFAVMVDGTNYTNNNGGASGITGDGNGLTDGTNSLSWTGGVASVFDITNTYTLGSTSEYVDISSQITMGVDATDVYFGRFIDPDARAASGDSSSTDNVLGYGVIPDSNVAFSEALSSRYALGLYSTDSNVDAGITGWTTDANSYTENAFDSSSNTNQGDNTIGLSWYWSGVSAGDIITANYAYIFGPSAFDAADTAITGGAGGGADVSSWGTLTDVGSATDAAESSSAPTVVSTTSVVGDPTLVSEVEGTATSATTTSTSGDTDITVVTVTTPTTYTYNTVTTHTDTMSDGTTQTREETATTTEVKNYEVATETRVTETETTGNTTTVVGDSDTTTVVSGDTTTTTDTITYTYVTPVSTTTSTITKVTTTDLDGNVTVAESDPVVSNTVFNTTTTEDKVWVTEEQVVVGDPTITLNSTETVVIDTETSVSESGSTVTETITVTKRDDLYKTSTNESFIRVTHTDPDGVVTVTESDLVIDENDYVEPGTAYTEVTTIATTTTENVTETVSTTLSLVETSLTHHESSVEDGVQTITREKTTATTTPMEVTTTTTTEIVTTHPDGSETTETDVDEVTVIRNDIDLATVMLDPFIGRMDQVQQLMDLNAHKGLGIRDGVTGGRITHDMGNGYSAESSVMGIGGNIVAEDGLRLGLGYNRVSTTMTGTDSEGSMETDVISFEAGRHIEGKGITVTGNVNVANSDINYSRTIGDFAGEGSTQANDRWGTITVEKSAGMLRPFAGYTIGSREVDSYAETGDIQMRLIGLGSIESYNYATVGVNLDTGLITASIARDFDDAETMRMSVGVDKALNEKFSVQANANRTTAGDNTSTFLTAGIKISF